MKKIFALTLVAAASLGLAACSEKPAAESTEVNAVDTNATADAAVTDINATADAGNASGAALDNSAAADAGANGAAAAGGNNAM